MRSRVRAGDPFSLGLSATSSSHCLLGLATFYTIQHVLPQPLVSIHGFETDLQVREDQRQGLDRRPCKYIDETNLHLCLGVDFLQPKHVWRRGHAHALFLLDLEGKLLGHGICEPFGNRPRLDGCGDVRAMHDHTDHLLSLVFRVEMFLGRTVCEHVVELGEEPKMSGHVGVEDGSDHDSSGLLPLLLGQIAEYVVFLLHQQLEGGRTVVILQHGNVIVQHCQGVLRVGEKRIGESRVIRIVADRTGQHTQQLGRLEVFVTSARPCKQPAGVQHGEVVIVVVVRHVVGRVEHRVVEVFEPSDGYLEVFHESEGVVHGRSEAHQLRLGKIPHRKVPGAEHLQVVPVFRFPVEVVVHGHHFCIRFRLVLLLSDRALVQAQVLEFVHPFAHVRSFEGHLPRSSWIHPRGGGHGFGQVHVVFLLVPGLSFSAPRAWFLLPSWSSTNPSCLVGRVHVGRTCATRTPPGSTCVPCGCVCAGGGAPPRLCRSKRGRVWPQHNTSSRGRCPPPEPTRTRPCAQQGRRWRPPPWCEETSIAAEERKGRDRGASTGDGRTGGA
eukprot:scaffold17_cov354-Pavlova_lutheri.AAC.15